MVTRTPAPAAQCPLENPTLEPDTTTWFDEGSFVKLKDESILAFLNQGGSPDDVIAILGQTWPWFGERRLGIRQDMTGDMDSPQYSGGPPWRKATNVYAWNGSMFVCTHMEYGPPEYRFQAVQDGDRAFLAGKYDQALDFYQQAIFSDKLENWTYERLLWEVNCTSSMNPCWGSSTPTAGSDEYYILAAYARYRIMLLHVLRGYILDAEIIYNTLQKRFSSGQLGHVYAEMAAGFWKEYQSSQSYWEACGKAIEYATAHPEDVLSHLGNGAFAVMYFGVQSLEYAPQDICPFR